MQGHAACAANTSHIRHGVMSTTDRMNLQLRVKIFPSFHFYLSIKAEELHSGLLFNQPQSPHSRCCDEACVTLMKGNHAHINWIIGISNQAMICLFPNGDWVTDYSTYFFSDTLRCFVIANQIPPNFSPTHCDVPKLWSWWNLGLEALLGITTQGSSSLKPTVGKCNFSGEEHVQ